MKRLYLRNLVPAQQPTAGKHSTTLPVHTLVGPVNENKALSPERGSAQVTLSAGYDETVLQDIYIGRFSSPPLLAQVIPIDTWIIAIGAALSPGALATVNLLSASIYVWRPSSSSVVGYIVDSHTLIGTSVLAGDEAGIAGSFAGASVTVQTGDILVLEIWFHNDGSGVGGATLAFGYDGTVLPVDSFLIGDAASYIEVLNDVPLLHEITGVLNPAHQVDHVGIQYV